MARDTARRTLAEMPAWIGAALLAIAGAASPFYARDDRVVVVATALLAAAIIITAIILVSRRRASNESAPTLATVTAKTPLEPAPDELRRHPLIVQQ